MNAEANNDSLTDARRAGFPVRQFLLMCIPAAVVIFVIAFAFTDTRFKEQLAQIVNIERIQLRQLGNYVATDVSVPLVHLRALSREAVVRGAMDSVYPRALQELQSEFLMMAERNPTYQQIRWIDEDGMERVRVTRDGNGVSATDVRYLQDKSNRYYFKAARSLKTGALYISRLDLNMEDGRDEMPVKPTLRVATPVQDGYGRRRGILIINIAMRHMIDALRSASEISADTDYSLINQEGYLLMAPGQQDETGSRPELDARFSRQHPAAWERMSTRYVGDAVLDDGFWVWEKLETGDAFHRAFYGESGGGGADMPDIDSSAFSVTVVAHRPARALAGLRREILIMVMLVATLFMGLYVWGLLFLLRGQSREKLAEMEIAYAMARAEQKEHLKELEKRFRLVVEASGVGMIVVDERGTILLGNSSAEAMLGYSKGGLKGLSVDSLLPSGQRTQHAEIRANYLRNPEARKMGVGRKLEALGADGRKIPVEVGLNPYRDHGKQLVLASIIDLSSAQGYPSSQEPPSS